MRAETLRLLRGLSATLVVLSRAGKPTGSDVRYGAKCLKGRRFVFSPFVAHCDSQLFGHLCSSFGAKTQAEVQQFSPRFLQTRDAQEESICQS